MYVELFAYSIIKDINIENNAIDKLDLKNDPENSGRNNFIIPPKKTIGIVPIKIDLHNFFEKYKLWTLLEFVSYKLKIFFLKYQNIAKILPICIVADKEEPGSLMPNNWDIIFKWAVLLTGINSVKPWTIPYKINLKYSNTLD